jgi:hypothetical protein
MTHLNERIPAFCDANLVPGYLAGVYRSGELEIVAHGTAT